MAAIPVLLLFLLSTQLAVVHSSLDDLVTIDVYPTTEDEMPDINRALSNLSSNTVLHLLSGQHQVTQFIVVENFNNITIIGDDNETIVTCDPTLGLAFINITELTLENIVIDNCGLEGKTQLGYVVDKINSTSQLFHEVYTSVGVGIVFGNVYDLVLQDVTISNSTVGMMAIDVLGSSVFDGVLITKNQPKNCTILAVDIFSTDLNGGGIILLYTDGLNQTSNVTLEIRNSTLSDNTNCGTLAGAPILYDSSITSQNLGYVASGGGGLSVLLAQFMYSINVTVTESVFKNNIGLYGGGSYIQHFRGSSGGVITFRDCVFDANGLEIPNYGSVGGASFIILNAQLPKYKILELLPRKIEELSSNIITFENCQITNNVGRNSAGIYMYSLSSEFTTTANQNQAFIRKCHFANNSATDSAPVLTALSQKYSGLSPGLQLHLDSVLVEGNNGTPSAHTTTTSGFYDSLITVVSMNVTLLGTSTFKDNSGSSILAVTSLIYIAGSVSFISNTAVAGGALQILASSYLVITDNSSLLFKNNRATIEGGAIFVLLNNLAIDVSQTQDCFLWFKNIDFVCQYGNCTDPRNLNFSLVFEDNQAPLGSAVYGSVLRTCPWKVVFDGESYITRTSGFTLLTQETSSVFITPTPFINTRVINTIPVRLIVDEVGNKTNNISSFPGGLVEFNATALDDHNQSVPLAITSIVSKSPVNNATSKLGLSGYWFLPGTEANPNVQLYIYGNVTNDANLTRVSLFSISSSATTGVYITVQECNYGFTLAELDNGEIACKCEMEIEKSRHIQCSETTGSLSVSSNYWVGESQAGSYTISLCVFDYCESGERSHTNQCSDNREGVLCGACSERYSIVFGSNECEKCGHAEWLIIIFLIMGVVLTACIAFLDFTVANGYVNIIIFFANISDFLMPLYSAYLGNVGRSIFIFMSLLNFSPGIPTCVFPNMDALTRTGLRLLFPIYLFALMVIYIIIARRSRRVSILFGFSGAKTFATLLLLCYSTLFGTCVEIFGYVNLSSENRNYVGWRIDPNVEYGKGVHGFLIFVALLLLIFYIIPFSLLLFSPPKILSKTWCGEKFRVKYQPLFDAFWAPFKPKYCFWVGFRCILRLIPYIIISSEEYPDNAFAMTLFVVFFMMIHICVQPFKQEHMNLIETMLLSILVLLAVGGLYYPQKLDNYDGKHSLAVFFVIVFVLVAYLVFVIIIVLHLTKRFPSAWNAIKNRFEMCWSNCYARCCPCCVKNEPIKSDSYENITKQFEELDSFSTKQFQQSNVTESDIEVCTTLREPLLDDDYT